MFARTSTWSGADADLDNWAAHMERTVAPMVRSLPGNAGGVFLVDRDTGRALTLTLWESEEAAAASDEAADKSRDATAAATGVTLLERGRYVLAARI
jgi:heme-degrading monooxygenase HmoA